MPSKFYLCDVCFAWKGDIDTPREVIVHLGMPESTLFFKNRSPRLVRVFVEPIASGYDVNAGETVKLVFDSYDVIPVEIEYHATDEVVIWTHALTTVYKNDLQLAPT